MEEKFIFCKLFFEVYKDLTSFVNKNKRLVIDDINLLEDALKNYLINVAGISIVFRYKEYYREIKKYLENIINNSVYENNNIINNIKDYGEDYNHKIHSNYYTNLFIEAMKKIYSDDDPIGTTISNLGNSFIISRMARKNEEAMPATYIEDINEFEKILNNFIRSILLSNTFFKKTFDNLEFSEAVSYTFSWVIKNASCNDLLNVGKFFVKYTNFINDDTFDAFAHPQEIGGGILNSKLFLMRKRSTVAYETPYYLAYMLVDENNQKMELPNIRLGIEKKDNEKIAHIIAIQSSQADNDINKEENVIKEITKSIPRSSKFRFSNPTHMVSLILTIGLLKSLNINKIEIIDYLPLRYQRLIYEKRKSEEELTSYQTRLTNQNIFTYMRMLENSKGIKILNYPEMDQCLKLELSDDICFVTNGQPNEFLQNLFDLGYNAGLNSLQKSSYGK